MQKCRFCGKDSIPGLVRGGGACQYHYNLRQFGKEWADEVEAKRKPPHVVRLIEKPSRRAICETKMRYAITLNGIEVSDVCFNTRGYNMTSGIPLPGESASFLQLHECGISVIKKEIAKINKETKGK
jgi:hypothetical protein